MRNVFVQTTLLIVAFLATIAILYDVINNWNSDVIEPFRTLRYKKSDSSRDNQVLLFFIVASLIPFSLCASIAYRCVKKFFKIQRKL